MRTTNGSGRELDLPVASQRRRQILDAAKACIAEEGAERTTLRNVAKRAGVSHATISYYFKGRKEMVHEALLEATDEFLEQLRTGHMHHSGQDALEEFSKRFLDLNRKEGTLVVQLLDAGLHDSALQRAHIDIMKLGGSWVVEAVQAGIDSGHYRRDFDPSSAAAAFHAALLWVGFQLRGGTIEKKRAEEIAFQALELLKPPSPVAQRGKAGNGAPAPKRETADVIRAALLSDEELPHGVAETLANSFTSLYLLAKGDSRKSRGAPP